MTTDAGGIFTSDGNRFRYNRTVFDGVCSFYRADYWKIDVSLGGFHEWAPACQSEQDAYL